MSNHCLNCKHWVRSHENPGVGICALYNENVLGAYRFQFEDCEQWLQGDVREPFYVQGKGMLITESLEPNHKRIREFYSRPFGRLPQGEQNDPA